MRLKDVLLIAKDPDLNSFYIIFLIYYFTLFGITYNLNLGLVLKPTFQGRFEKLRLGFELLGIFMFKPDLYF